MKAKKDNTHLVAFIDILGFSELVSGYFSGKRPEALKILKQALDKAKKAAIQLPKRKLKELELECIFKQFSDCVSISMPVGNLDEENTKVAFSAFVMMVRQYQFMLLLHGILSRGGISLGKHVENANMIFSEALIKAYKLESEKAIYPRILVDKNVISVIAKFSDVSQEEDYKIFFNLFGKNFIRDWDDNVFVSPFGIIYEQKLYVEMIGKEKYKQEYNKSADEINIKHMKDETIEDLMKSNIEHDTIRSFIKREESYLYNNHIEKQEVLLKHKWLIEFMNWHLDSGKSRIRFSHYFKPPNDNDD